MPLITASQFNLQPNIQGAIQQGLATRQASQAEQNRLALQQQQAQNLATRQRAFGVPAEVPAQETQEQAMARMMAADPAQARTVLDNIGIQSTQQKEDLASFATSMLSAPPEERERLISERVQLVTARGGDPSGTLQLHKLNPQQLEMAMVAGKTAALTELQRTAGGAGASQREFEDLMEGFTEEEKAETRRIKAGLRPRAVGSAPQTIAELGTAEEVGESQAVIKEREKFAEMTGSSRAKAIDKGFENIVRIGKGINTIDRAIATLEGGAKTGAVEKFLPSIRAASVELAQIEGQMALDVIGGVTLGAISEAELALAKTVALPKGLDEPALIKHLRARREAQAKLRDYFQEQIDWLESGGPDGKGGTVAGFLRMKRRGAEQPAAAAQPAAATQEATPPQQILKFNPATGRLE